MTRGELQYDPRCGNVKFVGAWRIAARFKDLPDEIKSILREPPHRVVVDVDGPPIVFRLANSNATEAPSHSVPAPAASSGDYKVIMNVPSVRLSPTPRREPAYQITDRGLALSLGNELSRPEDGLHPGLKLVQFGSGVPEVGGQTPSIDRNPYNFVAFGATEPYREDPPHPDHGSWRDDCVSGSSSLRPPHFRRCSSPRASRSRPREIRRSAKNRKPRFSKFHGTFSACLTRLGKSAMPYLDRRSRA